MVVWAGHLGTKKWHVGQDPFWATSDYARECAVIRIIQHSHRWGASNKLSVGVEESIWKPVWGRFWRRSFGFRFGFQFILKLMYSWVRVSFHFWHLADTSDETHFQSGVLAWDNVASCWEGMFWWSILLTSLGIHLHACAGLTHTYTLHSCITGLCDWFC